MMNFVLSFCRITAASKIFSRNFYLPLLKPVTPREAFRTFRITGKWLLGSKIQKYVPVLLNHKKKRSKNVKNYGRSKHENKANFSYMTPVLDPENETQKVLINILERKKGKGVFVYTVEDRQLNVVLQAQLEYAVRDGDVIDVLVSQKTDKVIIKLKDFKKVPVELEYFETKRDETLWRGEGATSEADEKLHHYGKYTMSLAKIFEDKERQEEEWETKLKEIIKRRRRNAAEKRKEYKALVKENLRKLDWDQFEEDAKKVIEEINEPSQENPIDMEIDRMENTLNVNEYFQSSDETMSKLPKIDEISDILKNLPNAQFREILIDETTKLTGVTVILSSGKEIFVSGQLTHTEDGEVFVPGQTIRTDKGLEYVPGFTVNIDGKPTLINGLIMAQNDKNPMFLPTQSAITADGQLTFALSEEERPPPLTEEHIKQRTERRLILENRNNPIEPTEEVTTEIESPAEELEASDESEFDLDQEEIIVYMNGEDSTDSDAELPEVDWESWKLKQERDRAELEELKKILLQDGMEKLVNDLEDKRLDLQQRLDELRKLKMQSERPLISYATERDAIEIASRITRDTATINKLVDILLMMIRKTALIRDRDRIQPENVWENSVSLSSLNGYNEKYDLSSKEVKILLKSAVVAANQVFRDRPGDQLFALEKIGDVLTEKADHLNELLDLMSIKTVREGIIDITVKYLTYDYRRSNINIIKKLLSSPPKHLEEISENLEKLLLENDKLLLDAILKLLKTDIKIFDDALNYYRKHSHTITMDNEVIDLIQRSIHEAVKSFLDNQFGAFAPPDNLIDEAISFATVLGHPDVANELQRTAATDPNELNAKTQRFLKKILLIKNLVGKDFAMKNAMDRLKRNPDQAKHDPRIRLLVRQSAVLTANGLTLRNSKTIPLHLLKTENLLGLEDFICQRMRLDRPILIIRNDLQAVIPKEAQQGVQTGRVPYVLIDESGISNFKPLHSLGALKGSKNVDSVKLNGDIDFSRGRGYLSRTSANFA